MKFLQVLSFGAAVVALVGCSTVEEEPWGDAFDAEIPEGEVPRALIVGEEGVDVEVVEAPVEVVAAPVVEEPAVVTEAVEEAVEEPVAAVEKKRKRGWWPFGRKEKAAEVASVVEPVEVPEEVAVVAAVPEPEPEEVEAEVSPVVEAPVAEVEEKRKGGWWPFGRKEKREKTIEVAEVEPGDVEEGEAEAEAEPEEEAVPPVRPAAAKKLAWRLRFPGVELLEIERSEPRLMKGWAARVNAADVEWKVTEGNGSAEGETSGLRTSTFLKDYRCDLAVNGAPFSPIELFEEQPQDIIGLQVSNGEIVSPADSRKPVLAFGRDGRGRVLEAGSYGDGSALWDAVAGFSVVLRDGSVVGGSGEVHPRTAAGVSRDGGTVYLLVIDGRQPGHSEGATTADLGRLLAEFGAWDGINLDGGGTTTMVVKGAGGKAEVVNRTINGGISGLERVSASHLGLRVK